MTAEADNLALVIVIAWTAVILAGASVVALVLGFRGRREGTTPHCAHCEYNLRGLAGDRCPECGAAIECSSVRLGVRVLSRRTLAMGIIGLAILVPTVVSASVLVAGNLNPYLCSSVSTVIHDADKGDSQARYELRRRVRAGDLAAWQITDLRRHVHQATAEAPPESATAVYWLRIESELLANCTRRCHGFQTTGSTPSVDFGLADQ